MHIVCVAVASPQSKFAMPERAGLPVQLVAIIADLIEAGHQVNWIERPLCQFDIDESLDRVARLNPDVLLFVCDGSPLLPLMAGIAVRCDNTAEGEYIGDSVLRTARYWCSTLTSAEIDVRSLRKKIERSHRERGKYAAVNDADITDVVLPV